MPLDSLHDTMIGMPKKKKVTEDKLVVANNNMLEELLEANCHFGHRSDRWNPKIAPYVFGVRDGVHIFDLEKTRDGLLSAVEELRMRASKGQKILFVGTKPQAKPIIASIAQKLGFPYISEHWVGGLLTNFSQIKKSIDKLAREKNEREAGEYKKFTKKEQLLIDRDILRLERIFGGVADLSTLPDVLFVVDVIREKIAVLEAIRMGIPVVAIVDTNADPTLVDFPIPANDDSTKSIEYILGKVEEALRTKVDKVVEVEKVEQALGA